jgi:hypothetical protein
MRRTILIVWALLAIDLVVEADTTWVSGEISSNTTWDISGSPYVVNGRLTVNEPFALTIEPGVQIRFKGADMFVYGYLYARGTEGDSISFNSFSPEGTDSRGRVIIRGTCDGNDYGIGIFEYCTFRNLNYLDDAYGGALQFRGSDSSEVSHCTFEGNEASGGGAISVKNGPPCRYDTSRAWIHHSLFKNNLAGSSGGAIILEEYSKAFIYDNTFEFNMADTNSSAVGGALVIMSSCYYASVHDNIFHSNCADEGGAIYANWGNQDDGTNVLTIQSNLIHHNHACSLGGGATLNNNGVLDTISFVNNTVVGNRADSHGGGLRFDKAIGTIIFKNNILWDDFAPNDSEISEGNTPSLAVSYCDIEGGYAGDSNYNEYPQFVDPTNYDYRLECESPCIDRGDVNDPEDYDLTRIDLGAYYFHQIRGSGDANNDCTVNLFDLYYLQNYFHGGHPPNPFWKGDANGNCKVNGLDCIYLSNYLRYGGPAPRKQDTCWTVQDTCDACGY